jgi:hypothetical protein
MQITNYTANTSNLYAVASYGPYIAAFFPLDTLNTTYLQPRKQYLNIDSNSIQKSLSELFLAGTHKSPTYC